ncbi:TasA family protein [Rhodoglobus aureus]|uniref:Ribosomally synthesized peptide with SipW-like signal peptide n=1 Tax=Rhodoglobus aureus TaxID=191497 RepID=A0ABP4G2A8_9MICO
MNSSTVRGSHRLYSVKGLLQRRSALSPASFSGGLLGTLRIAAVFTIAITVGLIGTGGTYAYLNSSAMAAPASILSAGTSSLAVGSQSLNWSALTPGKSVTGTFSITNTGDVPLVLSATIAATMTPSALANPFTISVANGTCPASGVPAGTLSDTLAAGASTSACLVVTLPANAPASAQSASASIVATIAGVQP